MTVSKVLRDADDISAATKVRVRQIADRMGYVPDAAARGLRTRSSRLIGLVVPSTTHPLFARTVMGIEEQAHALGYELVLAQTLNQPEREQECLRRLLARRVDGLLISPVYRLTSTAPLYDAVTQRKIPTVILGQRSLFCARFLNIESDDLAASSTATQHLIGLGHRRIGFFTGPVSSPAAQERYEGYRRALREAQVECDERLVFNAGSTIEEGETAALQFIQENPQATAIQCFNDLVATGLCRALRRQGIRVPGDISVVGYGNFLLAEYGPIPLTTLHQPKHSLGAGAVELLLKLIQGEPAESRRLPAQLVIRESTAQAPTLPAPRPPGD